MTTPDPIEQKRIDYLRSARVQGTLDRLEREDPTRWYHRVQIFWIGACVLATPFVLIWLVSSLWGAF